MDVRKMLPHEANDVYQMIYEEWGTYISFDEMVDDMNLENKRGVRYVATTDSGDIASTMILIHDNIYHPRLPFRTYGIGSVVTKPKYRKKGYAHVLLSSCMEEIRKEYPTSVFILYSEIDESFYHRIGFQTLPYEQQRYFSSTCMANGKKKELDVLMNVHLSDVPTYYLDDC